VPGKADLPGPQPYREPVGRRPATPGRYSSSRAQSWGSASLAAATRGSAVLDLEASVNAWSNDTEEDDGAEQARAVLRTLVLRLGQTADAVRDALAAAGVDLRDTADGVDWSVSG